MLWLCIKVELRTVEGVTVESRLTHKLLVELWMFIEINLFYPLPPPKYSNVYFTLDILCIFVYYEIYPSHV